MKVKARFGLFAAIACCGLLLAGCGGGGNTPEPETFHVVANYESTKVSVSGLGDTYAEGTAVSFTLTELDASHYKVDQVTSTDTTINRSGLNCNFIMPDSDVTINITTKAVDQYAVTISPTDVVVDQEVIFSLKYGTQAVFSFNIQKTTSETKTCVIDENKVTFKEEGTFHLKITDQGRSQVAFNDYTVEVRAPQEGESEDYPMPSDHAVSYGHTNLPLCSGNSDPDLAEKLSPYFWVEGKVIRFDAAYDPLYSNLTVTLEGGFSLYRVGCKSPLDPSTVKVGSILTLYCQFYNYGTSGTQANGKVQVYTGNTPKSQIRKINNSVLDSITLSETAIVVAPSATKTITAELNPDGGQTLSWKTDNSSIATVTPNASNSKECTITGVGIGETNIYAYNGTIYSPACHVVVSNTDMVFRALNPSEVQEDVDYYLCASDADGLAYAVDDVASQYYVKTTRNSGEASVVRVTKSDGKLTIKLGNSYIGYELSGTHHNILRESSVTSKTTKFTYDASSFRLTFNGTDASSTELYLNFYSNNMSYTKTSNANPEFSIYGYGAPVTVTDVTLSETSKSIAEGEMFVLSYTVSPKNGTVSTAVFSSNATAKATVDAATGLVTGVVQGSATITLTVNTSVTKTCAVTITAPVASTTITLTASELGITSSESPGSSVTATKDGLTLVLSAVWKNGSGSSMQARCGAHSTLTFSGKTILKIDFVCSGDANDKNYGPVNFAMSSGTIIVGGSSSERTGTWQGSDANLVLTCDAQVRLKSMTITVAA